jgi:hypothetical protein
VPFDRPEHDEPAGLALATLDLLRAVPPEDWTHGNVGELARRLHRLRSFQAFLRELILDIEETLVAEMEADTMDIAGVGRLRREETISSTWRTDNASAQLRDDLAAAIALSVSVDNATGESDDMKRNVAMATMRLAFEAIPSFSNLKVAGRSRLGLHMGDYRTYDRSYVVKVEAQEETL